MIWHVLKEIFYNLIEVYFFPIIKLDTTSYKTFHITIFFIQKYDEGLKLLDFQIGKLNLQNDENRRT